MSGQWNIAPLEVPGAGGRGGRGAGNASGGTGSTCGLDQPGAPLGIISGPSAVSPIDTDDQNVPGPILAWIKKVK
jgi:hypothetical protein